MITSEIIAQYAPSVIMVVISLWLAKKDRIRTEREKKSETDLAGFFQDVLGCIGANVRGTMALCECYKNDDHNGGLAKAVDALEAANVKIEDCTRRIAAEGLAKR